MSAATIGVLAKHGISIASASDAGDGIGGSGGLGLDRTRPFHRVPLHPESTMVDGLPFANWFTGDRFSNESVPFHNCENCVDPPAPTEEIDIAIVGGGISGLSTAYLLREHNPVVLEFRPRFGGVAQGEIWGSTRYSLGNAYVITPDSGSFLESFYNEMGLPGVVRVHSGEDLIEVGGKILDDFWSGSAKSPKDQLAYQRYAEVVTRMAEENYPEIPLIEGKDNQWILELDSKTFRQDIEDQMGMEVPPLLAGAIQAYCYSSFCAGWEEISAASGWNFLAAEEFGRWVCPGGMAYMSHVLWNKLSQLDKNVPAANRPHHLRAGCMVVDVRLVGKNRVQVAYIDARNELRSLLAKRVVMCCPKFLCKYIQTDLERLDTPKWDAMHQFGTRAYLVANVLLDTPVDLDFYDVFLVGDEHFPMTDGEAEDGSRVVDMLSGHYARRREGRRSVLTLYWPLPFDTGRFTLIMNEPWQTYASSLVPQIKQMLAMLKVPVSAVRQVRMTRWGHSLPLATPGLIASGAVDEIRRPFEGRVFYVNQDNWALPAVENCLLDAEIFTPQIAAGL